MSPTATPPRRRLTPQERLARQRAAFPYEPRAERQGNEGQRNWKGTILDPVEIRKTLRKIHLAGLALK